MCSARGLHVQLQWGNESSSRKGFLRGCFLTFSVACEDLRDMIVIFDSIRNLTDIIYNVLVRKLFYYGLMLVIDLFACVLVIREQIRLSWMFSESTNCSMRI